MPREVVAAWVLAAAKRKDQGRWEHDLAAPFYYGPHNTGQIAWRKPFQQVVWPNTAKLYAVKHNPFPYVAEIQADPNQFAKQVSISISGRPKMVIAGRPDGSNTTQRTEPHDLALTCHAVRCRQLHVLDPPQDATSALRRRPAAGNLGSLCKLL